MIHEIGDTVEKIEFKEDGRNCTRFEYLGPARILIEDTDPALHRKEVCEAVCLSFTPLLIGATVTVVILFSMSLQNPFSSYLHIPLCTVGFQLLIPLSILIADGRETSSIPLFTESRITRHVWFSVIGSGLGIAGTLVAEFVEDDVEEEPEFYTCNKTKGTPEILYNNYLTKNSSAHQLTAWGTCGLLGFVLFNGPLVMVLDQKKSCGRNQKIIHRFFGILCFASSSVCFILGLINKKFITWLECARSPEALLVLVSCCVVYTLMFFIIFGKKSCRKDSG